MKYSIQAILLIIVLFASWMAKKQFRKAIEKNTYDLKGGRVSLDRQKRFISDKLPVHIAACF